MYIHIYVCIYISSSSGMGWLRLVGRLLEIILDVCFAEYSLFYRALLQMRPMILRSLLLQMRPMILRSLLMVATPHRVWRGLVGSHFVWHDSSEDFLYTSYDATWLIYTWDMTHSRVTWLIGSLSAHIFGCHLAHSHIGHDSLICRTWLIHMWWWISHTYVRTYVPSDIRTYMHASIHTYMPMHTYINVWVRGG